MSALLYGIVLQWKLDLRDKGILLTYYIVPLVFFGFMGGIFTSIDPSAYQTLIPAMTVFGVTMGAIIGTPNPLTELYGSEMKKAYKVGGIPLWTAIVNNFISGFFHLFIMSLILFIIAPFAFDATVPDNIFLYFVKLAVFIAASLSIGTLLGLFVKSTSKLTMFSQFIFLPSIMLSGIMFPAELLPQVLGSVGKIFPATWGFLSMCESKLNVESLLPLVCIIIAAALISAWQIRRIGTD